MARSRVHRLLLVSPVVAALAACGAPVSSNLPAQDTSAAAIFDVAQGSMRSASSYHLTIAGKDPSARLDVSVTGPGQLQANLSEPQQSFAYIALGKDEYLKASASFYDSNPVLAHNVADKWVTLPQSGLIPLLDLADTKKAARCLLGRHGTLTKIGTTTLGGAQVVEIDDRGELAGTSPARFFFSADARRDLLQIEQTGVGTAGAGDDSCGPFLGGVPKTEAALSTIRIDGWRAHFEVAPPAQPIDLTASPYCGTPLGTQLSPAAQQFLLAVFELNRALFTVSQSCGCDGQNYLLLRQAVAAEVAADDKFAAALQRISATGQLKADLNAEVVAIYASNQLLRQAAATSNIYQYATYSDAIGQSKGQVVQASLRVRADLGLGSSTCSFTLP